MPENIVNAVKALISKWSTQLNLQTENSNTDAGEIRYNKGVLQGDFLSVVLFILSLNPGSFLINKTTGYKIGPEEDRRKSLTHLLFVDDMKTFSSSVNGAKFQLDIITTFSTDIGMKFGEDKCGYIYIERGKRKSLGQSIVINGATIRELNEGETYKYLGVEESIGYDGPINMEKVTTEYYRRIRIIWNSELNAKNKTTAHNCFALPIIVTTIGILDWTIKQLEDIDITKILTMTGNFHTNSDKDRLYVPRKEGGRGLKSIEDCYKSRIVGLRRHIIRDKERNHLLESVFDHEQERILRIGNDTKRCTSRIQWIQN